MFETLTLKERKQLRNEVNSILNKKFTTKKNTIIVDNAYTLHRKIGLFCNGISLHKSIVEKIQFTSSVLYTHTKLHKVEVSEITKQLSTRIVNSCIVRRVEALTEQVQHRLKWGIGDVHEVVLSYKNSIKEVCERYKEKKKEMIQSLMDNFLIIHDSRKYILICKEERNLLLSSESAKEEIEKLTSNIDERIKAEKEKIKKLQLEKKKIKDIYDTCYK